MFSSKVAQDVERHLLNTIVKLSDGTTGQVFSRSSSTNPSGIYSYNCHLCGVANLLGERCLQTHISGRKHQTKFAQPIIDAEQFRTPLFKRAQIQMAIAPGEPVPPGFENEVKPMAQIQNRLDKIKDEAVVGLEYLMELTMGLGKEPSYHCVLCDKRGDPRTINIHLTSYNHQLKYLEKHFPTVVREINTFRFNKDAREVMPKVVKSICEAIEDAHGRLTPNVYDNNNYTKNRMKYFQEVINDRHFDEKMGSSFLHIIDKKTIQDAINSGDTCDIKTRARNASPLNIPTPKRLKTRQERKSLDSVSSISSSSIGDKSPKIRINERRLMGTIDLRSRSRSSSISSSRQNKSRTRSKSPKRLYRGRSPTKRNRHGSKERQLPPTPRELAIQSCEIAKEGYKWEKYRCMVELALPELDKVLKEHEKNPEKHPMYPDEWKKFWNKRYKELQAEKKDPAKHDFKPEWIEFWTRRMLELHKDEVEKKKMEIRKKLNLPEDGKERTDELKQQYIMKVKSTTTIPTTERSKSRERPTSRRHRSNDRERSSSSSMSTEKRDDKSRGNFVGGSEKYPSYRHRKRNSASPEDDRYHQHYHRNSKYRRSKSPSPPVRKSSSYSHEYHSPNTVRLPYLREAVPPPPTSKDYYNRHRYDARYSQPDDWSMGRSSYYGPVKMLSPYYYGESKYGPPPPSSSSGAARSPPKYEEEDNEPLTVVSVLRLLTALEELLGSLGPKVNDLLARALALEKVKANSADDMLINEDNCVIFETIKEKLKGQLIAGVLEKNKVNAVKKAIKNVAAIIHEVTEKAKTKSKEEPTVVGKSSTGDVIRSLEVLKTPAIPAALTVPAALSVPAASTATTDVGISLCGGIAFSTIDSKEKQVIAQKIATALIVQGKTDVTEEQLEQLINVYIQMQQKSKETNKTLSTATYLAETSRSMSSNSITFATPAPIAAGTDNNRERIMKDKKQNSVDSNNDKQNEDINLPADASSALESLTDSDLQTLLQNFKDLSAEEQQHLIAYLKKLEANHPARVEKLRKFVNVDVLRGNKDPDDDNDNDEPEENEDDDKPMNKIIIPTQCKELKPLTANYAARRFSDDDDADDNDGNNVGTADRFRKKFVDSDDDVDDYSFDDVFRAASKNLKEKQMQQAESIRQDTDDVGSNVSRASSSNADSTSTQNLNISISDTQNLIANIMGSLQKNAQSQKQSNNNKTSSGTFMDTFSLTSTIDDDGEQSKFVQPPPVGSKNQSYPINQSHSMTNTTTQPQQQTSSAQHQLTQIQLQLPQQQPRFGAQKTNVPFYQQQQQQTQQNQFYPDNSYANQQSNTANTASAVPASTTTAYAFNGAAQNGSGYYGGNYGQGYNNGMTAPFAIGQDYTNANNLLYGNLGYGQNSPTAIQQPIYQNFAQQPPNRGGAPPQSIHPTQQTNAQINIQQQRQMNLQPRPLMMQSIQNQQQLRGTMQQTQPRQMLSQKQIRPNQQQQQQQQQSQQQQQQSQQQQRYGANQFGFY